MQTPLNSKATAEPIKTAAPIEPGACGSVLPEYGRIPDVHRLYGLRRGTVYNLIAAGLIKSAVIRRKGATTGIRLIHLGSVRDFINSQLA